MMSNGSPRCSGLDELLPISADPLLSGGRDGRPITESVPDLGNDPVNVVIVESRMYRQGEDFLGRTPGSRGFIRQDLRMIFVARVVVHQARIVITAPNLVDLQKFRQFVPAH